MLIYASLMPFDLASLNHSVNALLRFWRVWPIDPGARISGSDVMSNLVLYVPLGWIVAVRCKLGRLGSILSMMLSLLICSMLSVCIEIAQMATVSRVASAADWLLNTVSGFAGALAGILWGEALCTGGLQWLQKCWRTRPANIGTLVFLSLLAADAWAPFMPTILIKHVRRSLKRSHFDIAQGLELHPWHWWVATQVLVYAVVTILLANWGKQKKQQIMKAWVFAAFQAAGFALVLEVLKLVIVSRSFNIANIVTSWAGCLAALLIPILHSDRMAVSRKLELMMAALLAYIIYLWWTPFNFVWNLEMVRKALPSPVQLLPFYHYAMGAELNHIRLFLQSVFLSGLLIYLMRIRFGWSYQTGRKVIIAVSLSIVMGLILEGGQLFLPPRTPSMTDVYCFALGGGLGVWLPPLANKLNEPADGSLSVTCMTG
jgi:VanZ family protein